MGRGGLLHLDVERGLLLGHLLLVAHLLRLRVRVRVRFAQEGYGRVDVRLRRQRAPGDKVRTTRVRG